MKEFYNKGDLRKWFKHYYELNFVSLFNYAYTITKDHQAAEDVVSDVFLNLWKMRDNISGIKDINSYLFISTKHLAIASITKNSNRNSNKKELENSIKKVDKESPEEVLLEKELLQVLEKTVASLPEHCQLVYRLVREKQMSYKEVAIELGISERTVRNQLQKAIRKIREVVLHHFDMNRNDNIPFSDYGSYSLFSLLLVDIIFI